MDIKDLQILSDSVFKEHFGYTSLQSRIADITDEFFEFKRNTDTLNLQEEVGDLLADFLVLCQENGWCAEELIQRTLTKIKNRAEQYKSLGRKLEIAILGGAFNPIHLGHIQLAQFILKLGIFDEIWLMPAFDHMFKNDIVSSEHRLEMCRLATKTDNRIKIFDYEIVNKLHGETYYTVKKMKEEFELNEKHRFTFIMGLDNANNFDNWVNHDELEKLVKFIVIPRKGIDRDPNVNWYLQKPHIWVKNETPIMDISSTEIREMLNEPFDNNIFKFLDKNVFEYIINNQLYINDKK